MSPPGRAHDGQKRRSRLGQDPPPKCWQEPGALKLLQACLKCVIIPSKSTPPCIGGMGSTFRPKMPFFETYCALRDRDGSAKVENKVIMMVYITTDHRDLVLTVLAGGGGGGGLTPLMCNAECVVRQIQL